MRTEYVTTVNDAEVYRGTELESAIRAWDASTYMSKAAPPGGISVQTWRDDVMVRDGWVLHVRETGSVYLNPNLTDGLAS